MGKRLLLGSLDSLVESHIRAGWDVVGRTSRLTHCKARREHDRKDGETPKLFKS